VAFFSTLGPSRTPLRRSFSVKRAAHRTSHGAPRWGKTRSRKMTFSCLVVCLIRSVSMAAMPARVLSRAAGRYFVALRRYERSHIIIHSNVNLAFFFFLCHLFPIPTILE